MDQVCIPLPHATAAAIASVLGVVVPLCSILAHSVPAESWYGKLISYVALNFGKTLEKP